METVDQSTGEIFANYPAAIAEGLVTVLGKIRQLGKDSKNEHGKYNYVSIDKFLDSIGPELRSAGLILMIDELEADIRASEKGSAWLFAKYELFFIHSSGAVSPRIGRRGAMPISGPQAFGSLQSYVQKQFLRATFCIPTGDKDADEEAPREGEAPPSRVEPPQQPAQRSASPATAGEAPKDTQPSEDETVARAVWQPVRSAIAAAATLEQLAEVGVKFKDGLAALKRVSPTGWEQISAYSQSRKEQIMRLAKKPEPSGDEPPI